MAVKFVDYRHLTMSGSGGCSETTHVCLEQFSAKTRGEIREKLKKENGSGQQAAWELVKKACAPAIGAFEADPMSDQMPRLLGLKYPLLINRGVGFAEIELCKYCVSTLLDISSRTMDRQIHLWKSQVLKAKTNGDVVLGNYREVMNLGKTGRPRNLQAAIFDLDKEGISWDLESAQRHALPNTTPAYQWFDWFCEFIEPRSEPMPHAAAGVRSLFGVFSWREVYQEYVEDFTEKQQADQSVKILSERRFRELRKAIVPYVRCQRCKSQHNKCESCDISRDAVRTACKENLKRAVRVLRWHKGLLRMLRVHAANRKTAALRKEYTLVRVDAAGKDPHKAPTAGREMLYSKQLTFKVSLHQQVGTLDTFVLGMDDLYSWDANFVVDSIARGIAADLNARGSSRPSKAVYVLDGAQDNQNNVVLGFLELMVSERVFLIVDIDRYPVGHTANEADRVFGVQKSALLKRGVRARTPQEYQHVAATAAQSKAAMAKDGAAGVVAVFAPYIANAKEYMGPFVHSSDEVKHYWSKEDAVGRFSIEAVEKTPQNPLGTKIKYRRMVNDDSKVPILTRKVSSGGDNVEQLLKQGQKLHEVKLRKIQCDYLDNQWVEPELLGTPPLHFLKAGLKFRERCMYPADMLPDIDTAAILKNVADSAKARDACDEAVANQWAEFRVKHWPHDLPKDDQGKPGLQGPGTALSSLRLRPQGSDPLGLSLFPRPSGGEGFLPQMDLMPFELFAQPILQTQPNEIKPDSHVAYKNLYHIEPK